MFVESQFRMSRALWGLLLLATGMLLIVFWAPIVRLVVNWMTRPEYSHGLVIPLVSAYLIWQRRDVLQKIRFEGSWLGVAIVVAGSLLWLIGELSAIYAVTQFALVVVIAGLALSLVGVNGFRPLFVPVLLLFLTIPLPRFLYENFSSQMQLLSSEIGVAILRMLGVSVFLEGNVIDLGHFSMQVVEACDGLRYLFPMMTLALVIAYFFKGRIWQKALIFLLSIPITIGMNSLRIAMIGLFADFGNTALAEGMLHDVQGWVLFMLSSALLLAIIWLMTMRRPGVRSFADVFDLGPRAGDTVSSVSTRETSRRTPLQFVIAVTLLLFSTGAALAMPSRAELVPDREFCFLFPMNLGDWAGRREVMESLYFDKLKLDDYVLADYVSVDGRPVNFYLAYYDSQRKGESVHSPKACLPGGGWELETFGRHWIDVDGSGKPVNRAVIRKGNERQIVYYWFKQRDRWLTNEFSVKWYLLIDSLIRNRTDGALVRLVTPASDSDDIAEADDSLGEMASLIDAHLARFVPD